MARRLHYVGNDRTAAERLARTARNWPVAKPRSNDDDHALAVASMHSLPRSSSFASAGSLHRSPSAASSSSGYVSNDLSHGLFDDERRWTKQSLRVGAPWDQLVTDKPWSQLPANQIDVRCEAMRHVQKELPEGSTAIERKQAAKRLAQRGFGLTAVPVAPRGSPAAYAQPESSRFALHNTRPQAHDAFYRKSAMPVGSSLLENYWQGVYGPRF